MTATNGRVSFGIKTSQSNVTYDEILKVWLEADEEPVFEHAWLWDHFIPLRGPANGAALEAWTLLAALAAQTKRLRLGIIVTSNRIRPPAVLAKMAATVDVIARGRLEFGIGAGGSAQRDPALNQIVHREYDAYGIDVVPTPEAIGALGEACTIIKRMWTEDEPFDFEGRHYQVKGAICEPKPVQRPRPPIMIGAAGEKLALRVVAEHADIWNCPTRGDVDEFRRKSAVLDDHCAAIGRMLLHDKTVEESHTGFLASGLGGLGWFSIVMVMFHVSVVQSASASARKAADDGSLPAGGQPADHRAARRANADSLRGFHVPLVFDIGGG